MERNEDKAWSSGGIWKFKTSDKKTYGSPLLDAGMRASMSLEASSSLEDDELKKMVDYLKSAFDNV